MALTQYQKLTFTNKQGIFSYLAIFIYWLSNLIKKCAAMARCLRSSIYIQ